MFSLNRLTKKLPHTGFTIVELLVVISMIGILSLTGSIAYNEAQKTIRDNLRITQLNQLKLALVAYREDHGHFPLEADGFSGGYAGVICTDPAKCPASRVGSEINQMLSEYLGAPVADPLHDETSSGDSGYWYYYDGGKNCNSSYRVITVHARQMETDRSNISELESVCDDFAGSAGEGGGISAVDRTAYLLILDYVDR